MGLSVLRSSKMLIPQAISVRHCGRFYSCSTTSINLYTQRSKKGV